jgi:uncharacterized protein YcaQ
VASTDITYGTGTAAERARRTAQLVDDGILLPVAVEGLRHARYILAEEAPILAAAGEVPPAGTRSGVTFLAPLDPFVWDRRLLGDLFGFSYTWEVYVPAARRRHGYYVLPILFGSRLVGRFEPRYERRERRLEVLGAWFEEGFDPLEADGFLPALGAALAAYAAFVGARRVTWPRTRPGREIAGALRRL